MKSFHRKRPEMRPGKVVFAWDNAPVHTSVSVRGFLAARDMKMLLYPPYYSLDLAPANFFLFPSVKSCLLYTSPSPRDRQKSRMPSSA